MTASGVVVHPPAPKIRVFLPATPDPPCLITEIEGSLHHRIVLPREWEVHTLASLAHLQAEANGLKTFLVLDRRTAFPFRRGDVRTFSCGVLPVAGRVVMDRLAPAATMRETGAYRARVEAGREECRPLPKRLRPGRWMGGRAASPEEVESLEGRQWNGLPEGLVACPVCGEGTGECLAGRGAEPALVRVRCRCEPPSLCALCRAPLHERRLGTCHYDVEAGRVVYVPGFAGLDHRCG